MRTHQAQATPTRLFPCPQFGGAIDTNGELLLDATTLLKCSALSGGILYCAGGRTVMSRGTLLIEGKADVGSAVQLIDGSVVYVFPAPPARWLPNGDCQIFRQACPRGNNSPDGDSEKDQIRRACLTHRRNCALNATADENLPPWYCQPPTFAQPCDWRAPPEMVGELLYQLPLQPVEGPFPYPCPTRYLGSALSELQTSSTCAGLCPAGSLCAEEATAEPRPCDAGAYCPRGSSVLLPCPLGFFTSATNLTSADECTPCPPGAYCRGGEAEPVPCGAGSHAPFPALGACPQCPAGSSQELIGQANCTACEPGTYAANDGQQRCSTCPYKLGSPVGSIVCAQCDSEFYLKLLQADLRAMLALKPRFLMEQPDLCKECPPDAVCDAPGALLETLGVPIGFWRDSIFTSELHWCGEPSACLGSGLNMSRVATSAPRTVPAAQAQGVGADRELSPSCADGHVGPLCQVCSAPDRYFRPSDRRCVTCPSTARFTILAACFLVVAALAAVGYRIRQLHKAWQWLGSISARLNLQAKLKIVVSFFRVCTAIGPVYGVELHPGLLTASCDSSPVSVPSLALASSHPMHLPSTTIPSLSRPSPPSSDPPSDPLSQTSPAGCTRSASSI